MVQCLALVWRGDWEKGVSGRFGWPNPGNRRVAASEAVCKSLAAPIVLELTFFLRERTVETSQVGTSERQIGAHWKAGGMIWGLRPGCHALGRPGDCLLESSSNPQNTPPHPN